MRKCTEEMCSIVGNVMERYNLTTYQQQLKSNSMSIRINHWLIIENPFVLTPESSLRTAPAQPFPPCSSSPALCRHCTRAPFVWCSFGAFCCGNGRAGRAGRAGQPPEQQHLQTVYGPPVWSFTSGWTLPVDVAKYFIWTREKRALLKGTDLSITLLCRHGAFIAFLSTNPFPFLNHNHSPPPLQSILPGDSVVSLFPQTPALLPSSWNDHLVQQQSWEMLDFPLGWLRREPRTGALGMDFLFCSGSRSWGISWHLCSCSIYFIERVAVPLWSREFSASPELKSMGEWEMIPRSPWVGLWHWGDNSGTEICGHGNVCHAQGRVQPENGIPDFPWAHRKHQHLCRCSGNSENGNLL